MPNDSVLPGSNLVTDDHPDACLEGEDMVGVSAHESQRDYSSPLRAGSGWVLWKQ